MISYLVSVINLLAATIQKFLFAASFVGKVIVSILTGITLAIFQIINSVLLFFQIIYEDNISVLTEDLPNLSNYITWTLTNQWTSLQNVVVKLLCDINNKFGAVFRSLNWFMQAVIIIVFEVLILIKNAVVFLGDTIWFIIIFIPVHLPELMKVFINHTTEVIITGVVELYMSLLKVTNFLTDVPLQSFIGILSAIAIVRLCIHFKEDIISNIVTYYYSAIRKLWYCYYALYNYFIDTEVRNITIMSGEEVGTRPYVDTILGDDDNSDALCVICQERQKCVLTLPCRHVCLCTECCMRLYGYQRTCPICRTFIYHSVTVYL